MTTRISLCERCDTRNPDDARFCVICGTPLVANAPQPTTYVPPARQPNAPQAAPYAYQPPAAFSAAPAVAGAGGPVVQNIYVNQTLPVMRTQDQTINFLIRAVWFLFVGLWLGQMWLLVAWLFNLTLIGLPIGLWMINKMPQVMTLRPNQQPVYLATQNGQLVARSASSPFVVRAIYFVLVGWWVSLLWLQLAWLASASLIGLPLSFLMFERTAAVATLGD